MKALVGTALTVLCVAGSLFAPAQAGWDANKDKRVQETIEVFKKRPGLKIYFDQAYGYAVFPNVVKGAWFIGGAHGKGLVYERGVIIGSASVSQGSIGFQWGGQSFREIVFFKDKSALERFKKGDLELSARASAVAVETGAATTADYHNGVAVFTLTKKGLMAEASIGGQAFNFVPNK
ncbi:MAG: YSC84-related protein [Acidiferrobacterales bacterium]